MIRSVLSLVAALTLAACSPQPSDTNLSASAEAASVTPLLAPLAGANWTVEYGASALRFAGKHAGKDFKGAFETFEASIRFDPADLANSEVVVVVDTGSARTGDKFQESSLREGEWFDVASHPTARFQSRSFREVGPGLYELSGDLTIKGATVPVAAPFRLSVEGDRASVEGAASLDRLVLNLGVVSDPKGEWVSAQIPLEFTLTATRNPVP